MECLSIEDNIKLWNADCLEAMYDIDSNSVDMVLCDLPYGTTSCHWDVIIPFKLLWSHYKRIVKENGAVVLFGSQPFTTDLINSNRDMFRYEIIWHKNFSGGFSNARKRPMKYHENICVFYIKQPTYNPQFEEYAPSVKQRFSEGENVNTKKQLKNSTNSIHGGFGSKRHSISFKRGKYPSSVQRIKGVPNANGKRIHPTQKPVKLSRYLIRTYTNKGDLVLDNCMGSGTTAIACYYEDRRFIGIELDSDYYNSAVKRFETHISQKTLF